MLLTFLVLMTSPMPASANADQDALSMICANNVNNGTVSRYATYSNYALVACGASHIDLKFVARKTGPTWSLVFTGSGRLYLTTLTSHDIPSDIADTLLDVIEIAQNTSSTSIPHVTVENEIFSPAVQITGPEWLVNMVTFRGIDSSLGIVMRVPCSTSDPAAGKYHATEVSPGSYFNYGCTAQVIPAGRYKGLLISQFGQVFAKPPQ